jgi:hypothetical protein
MKKEIASAQRETTPHVTAGLAMTPKALQSCMIYRISVFVTLSKTDSRATS